MVWGQKDALFILSVIRPITSLVLALNVSGHPVALFNPPFADTFTYAILHIYLALSLTSGQVWPDGVYRLLILDFCLWERCTIFIYLHRHGLALAHYTLRDNFRQKETG